MLNILGGSDNRLLAWMENPGEDFERALAFCARQRRLYLVSGILFAAVVSVASWFAVPAVYIPCFIFSIVFFVSSLHYDSYRKLLLLLKHSRNGL